MENFYKNNIQISKLSSINYVSHQFYYNENKFTFTNNNVTFFTNENLMTIYSIKKISNNKYDISYIGDNKKFILDI